MRPSNNHKDIPKSHLHKPSDSHTSIHHTKPNRPWEPDQPTMEDLRLARPATPNYTSTMRTSTPQARVTQGYLYEYARWRRPKGAPPEGAWENFERKWEALGFFLWIFLHIWAYMCRCTTTNFSNNERWEMKRVSEWYRQWVSIVEYSILWVWKYKMQQRYNASSK